MTNKVLLAPVKWQFVGPDGIPLAGYKVFTYQAGTTTKAQTWTDETGLTPNTDPIILDSRGEATVFVESANVDSLDVLPPGPPGPAGAQGVPGVQGAPGAPGLSNQLLVTTIVTTDQILNLNDIPIQVLPPLSINFYYAITGVYLQSTIIGGQMINTLGGTLQLNYDSPTGLQVLDTNYAANVANILTQTAPATDAPVTRIVKGDGFGASPKYVDLLAVSGKKVVLSSASQWAATQQPGPIFKANIHTAGTGYATNDVGTINGSGTGGTYKILVQSGGIPSKVQLTAGGTGYNNTIDTGTTHTSGSGTGLTLDIYVLTGNGTSLWVGIYYSLVPVFQDRGGILTVTAATGTNFGTGYAVGDTGSIVAGNQNATYIIDAVDGGGGVTGWHLTYIGGGYSVADNVPTTTGGAQPGVGTGFEIRILSVTP